MQLQLIRNATMVLDYAGHRLLADPFFAPKHSRPSFTGASPNPLVDLPIPPERILEGVELVIVSHLHSDHFDPVAQELVPKALPLLCQPGDDAAIREKGFQEVTPVTGHFIWRGVRFTRVLGHHGQGEVEAIMGRVAGFILRADDEPTVYWAGDTVLCDEVREAIQQYDPEVIITHSSGAIWPDSSEVRQLIVMNAPQTVEVCQLAPDSTVVAVHMEALDHGTVSRADLRAAADQAGIGIGRLRIPADGERVDLAPAAR